VEVWTEVNLVTARPLDESLLVDVVDGLVHGPLREDIATWFYFWEPELRLRIRWHAPDRAPDHRRALALLLDEAKRDGRIRTWYEGAHGTKGETYVGEAAHYGEEAWPRIQKDWMNGSELALELLRLERTGRLSHPLDYHWQRHVHLVTNQLFGSWEAEIELCLRQALGYLKLLGAPTDEATKLIAQLHDFQASAR
jgi:hypothetical protein